MKSDGAIERRIHSSLIHFSKGEYEDCLIHLFPAMDRTAKKLNPNLKVGQRIKKFILDYQDIMTCFSLRTIFSEIICDEVTLPDAIYKLARNSLAHEGELDSRLKINKSGELLIGNDEWSIPSTYVLSMIIAVMSCKVNAGCKFHPGGNITINGNEFEINNLWGAEAALRGMMPKT